MHNQYHRLATVDRFLYVRQSVYLLFLRFESILAGIIGANHVRQITDRTAYLRERSYAGRYYSGNRAHSRSFGARKHIGTMCWLGAEARNSVQNTTRARSTATLANAFCSISRCTSCIGLARYQCAGHGNDIGAEPVRNGCYQNGSP